MYEVPRRALEELRPYVADLEPARIPSEQAAELLEVLIELERVVAAARILLAPRAAESGVWIRAGHSSAASWLAEVTGSGFGDAIRTIETGERLARLPDTADALRGGRLSSAQAHEIAAAATKNPDAEQELLEAAEVDTFKQLKDRARKAKARAASDEEAAAREERIRRSRYLRSWTDDDGAVRLDARLTPVDGASVLSALEAEARGVFDEARAQGREEPSEAYLADALVSLMTRPGGDTDNRGPRHLVHLRVDIGAVRRGSLAEGECCEIPGVGPVSLSTFEHLVGDAYMKLFICDGVDVLNVVHKGRAVPAYLESALEERDPVCVVPGCGVARGLETDHWQIPFAKDGPTELWNLARLCRHHHRLKTYGGWQLSGGPGKWEFRKPASMADAPLAVWEAHLADLGIGVDEDDSGSRLLFDGL